MSGFYHEVSVVLFSLVRVISYIIILFPVGLDNLTVGMVFIVRYQFIPEPK